MASVVAGASVAGAVVASDVAGAVGAAAAAVGAAVGVLVLTVAQLQREPGKPNPYALYDLGQAVANLTVQATALGLSVHQLAGFDPEQARGAFAIPEDHTPLHS
ncbi:MAG: hypothetical protein HGA45_14225 [Chloroflexales bacterium]|nr:hypothetical protein [Chloroflexales bacterium]